ncbi:LacI family DNA-binding transcriptional regulator [Kaistia dalseonensis]|uniref:DNA-binding LacI/PurR family transcriptional regulator n=1 Tax=Kaistia dalseonensis TaxID=410840 RepID=A0ABU0HBZ2_9HYPH|nr:LacI family DNA-binding transcriptional regulator [Kaistia dalseonensis]MCX5496871.1 LacI family DNA-binding transcriptional regulator [Kaistia dalseonensis]MDQ0439497.1 DNA-binding LacI/PurR family transcriptional regulator [Kaistia dalseonensis]
MSEMSDQGETWHPTEPRRGLTLRALGEQLGLSTATISLALRDSPLVAESTRLRVRALAEEVGYVANRSAASLRTARTNMVGVVVHDVLNPYFAEIFRAVEGALNAQSLAIMICNHGDDVRRQRTFVETLMQHRADGLIICPAVGTTPEEMNRIARSGMPCVMICRDVGGTGEVDLPMVRGDDFAGSRSVTRHLIAAGHQRIAFVGGRRASSAGRERHAGYAAAHEEAGLTLDPTLHISEAMTAAGGRDAAPHLLSLSPPPTAIFGFNDLVASGLIAALHRAGITPGRDIAVAGYDDTELAAWSTPALTSVFNVPEQIGSLAADLLRRQIEGERVPPEHVLIEPALRIRESTDPAKR